MLYLSPSCRVKVLHTPYGIHMRKLRCALGDMSLPCEVPGWCQERMFLSTKGYNLLFQGQVWAYRCLFPVFHYWTRCQSYLLHIISKPSQKSRTFTSEIIAQFLQFTKSTSWSPNSWLKASGFQSSDLSFLCTPETNTGCGNKSTPFSKHF